MLVHIISIIGLLYLVDTILWWLIYIIIIILLLWLINNILLLWWLIVYRLLSDSYFVFISLTRIEINELIDFIIQWSFDLTKWILMIELNRLWYLQLTLPSINPNLNLRWCLNLLLIINPMSYNPNLLIQTPLQLLYHFISRWHYLYSTILELLYKWFQYWLLILYIT